MATAIPARGSYATANASWSGLAWHRFRKKRLGMLALLTLAVLVVAVVLVPLFSPFSVDAMQGPLYWLKPMGTVGSEGHVHLLGTDNLGRDIFTRLFTGGRTTLAVALVAALAVVVIGSLLGAIAGYYGGWVDKLLMLVVDFLLAFPLLPAYIFAIRIVRDAFLPAQLLAIRGINITTQSSAQNSAPVVIGVTILVLVMFGWMGICRLVRSSILSLRSRAFVEAARALGASNRRIILRHLLPNSIGPLVVAAAAAVGDFVIIEAVLAYFNQGIIDFFTPSWGNMLASTQGYIFTITELNPWVDMRPYLIILPTFMILLTVLCIYYAGDALREVLDPHQTEGR
jgi:peptide/nickel transport system permease protein